MSQADYFAFLCLSVSLSPFCFLASDKVTLLTNGEQDTYQVWNNDNVIYIPIFFIVLRFLVKALLKPLFYFPAQLHKPVQILDER